ncbi:FAD-dependent oxidoreductase [Kiritimatiellaeota bacterium B1221]|nr:FAD-dependent oxidoreductase [Kiritimatiellaeota bacterium B1221]
MKTSELQQEPEYALSIESGEGQHPKDFHWMDINVPCRTACPAGTDIPGYLEAIYQGKPEEAYKINLRDNIFPAVLGRTCTRPCEPSCRHGREGLGDPVAICFAKRSADDFRTRQDPILLEKLFPPSGKKVAIIGAGASGLSLARELCLWGHQVTLFEKHAEAGGLMIQGIPEFRLPRDMVRREVNQVLDLGIELRCNEEMNAEKISALQNDFDAVVLAAGTHDPRWPACPGTELPQVQHGLEFLKAINQGARPDLGKNVVIIGGGFTAVDCARMARRLGSENVKMVYRRSEAEMYIGSHEFHQFATEGVQTEFLAAPKAFLADADGNLSAVQFVKTELKPGEDGRAVPVEVPGSEFEVEADSVLLGTGQQTAGWWKEIDGLFVAGDAHTGPGSLIDAIGHGKKIARQVDLALMGNDRFEEVVIVEDATTTGRTREMDDFPRLEMPEISAADRGVTDEVEVGLSDEASKTEASRCYLCHYKFEIDNELCIYCDRCLKVTPVDGCIVKVSDLIYDEENRISGFIESTSTKNYNRLHLNQNDCIRCGACVEVCPVDCISLQKVTRETRPKV